MIKLFRIFVSYLYRVGQREYQKSIYAGFKYKYDISNTFKFNGGNIQIYGNGKLVIGENTYIGSYSTLQIDNNTMIKIGNNCRISHNVRMYTSSIVSNQDLNKVDFEKYFKDVIIGDGVWIGANTFINPGVIVENNSIIGANSVVTGKILENGIYGGVPAKLLRFKK